MLFKIRQTIQENMHVFRTHNHVDCDFVEGALQKKDSIGVTEVDLYYFYMHALHVASIDAHFNHWWMLPYLRVQKHHLKMRMLTVLVHPNLLLASGALLPASGLSGLARRRNGRGEGDGTDFCRSLLGKWEWESSCCTNQEIKAGVGNDKIGNDCKQQQCQ